MVRLQRTYRRRRAAIKRELFLREFGRGGSTTTGKLSGEVALPSGSGGPSAAKTPSTLSSTIIGRRKQRYRGIWQGSYTLGETTLTGTAALRPHQHPEAIQKAQTRKRLRDGLEDLYGQLKHKCITPPPYPAFCNIAFSINR
ncbi:ORF3 [torque teno Delphinidae virus 48]